MTKLFVIYFLSIFLQAENEEELEKAIDTAIEIGYRHIDTAFAYNNEQIIGKVLKKWFASGKLSSEIKFYYN